MAVNLLFTEGEWHIRLYYYHFSMRRFVLSLLSISVGHRPLWCKVDEGMITTEVRWRYWPQHLNLYLLRRWVTEPFAMPLDCFSP